MKNTIMYEIYPMSHMKMYNDNDNEETHCKDVHENQVFHMFKLTKYFTCQS